MTLTFTRAALVLGLLAAIGPFAIDMYLPTLPVIVADLHTTTAAAQMTLMIFFVGFGMLQLVYGPLADMLGRKPPLYIGLGLFIAGTIGCAFAPSIAWLIAFRGLQGIGAASVMVVPRAVIRDLHTGVEAARLMALIMLVISVAPILAPLFGSALIVPFGWRAVFVAVTVIAVLAIVLVGWVLPETLAKSDRARISLSAVITGYGRLLRDRRFLGLTFIAGFCLSSFFAFLASSSFIYIDHFGLTPTQFSVAFAVNAIGFIGSSQFSAMLSLRLGMVRVVMLALIGYAVLAVALFALTVAGVDNLAVLIVMLFLTFACQGLVMPTTMVLALDEHGPIAGMASALGGTLQFAAGSITIAIVSLAFDGTPLPMVAAIAGSSLVALVLAWVTLPRHRQAAANGE